MRISLNIDKSKFKKTKRKSSVIREINNFIENWS